VHAGSDRVRRFRQPVSASASGVIAASQRRAPASSRLAISCTSASAQAQPYGRSNRPSSLATKRASAASFPAVNWASSAAMISSAGTAGPASRSSRTSSQCISTQECQSRLP